MTSAAIDQKPQRQRRQPLERCRKSYILVVGCGATGRSCVRWLQQYETPVVVADSRRWLARENAIWQQEFPHIDTYYGDFNTQLFANAQMIVISPGVSMREPAIRAARVHNIPVVSDIELFLQHAKAPIIAVTGTNGKSTVATLVAEMLRQQGRRVSAGANLGTPALELLPQPQGVQPALPVAAVDHFVLELSSFQLEATHSLRADSAVVLNLSEDHGDRYADDRLAYAAAKAKVYRNCRAPVVNLDDAAASALYAAGTLYQDQDQDQARHATGAKNCCTYSLREGVQCDFGVAPDAAGSAWVVHRRQALLPLSAIPLQGQHNQSNVLAACALGHQAGCDYSAITRAVAAFRASAHRCEWVLESNGVRWVNDSKGTNVGATVAAIKSIGALSPIVLIAGGDAKGADFAPLRAALGSCVQRVILFGRDALQIEAALAGATAITQVADLDAAVASAIAASQPGDTVLFSPACASFDMFSDYAERGERFKQHLRKALDGEKNGNLKLST